MSGSVHAHHRQRYLVEPKYQWQVTKMLIIAMLSIVLLTLVLVFVALWSTLAELELWPGTVFIAVFRAVAWVVVVEMIALVPIVLLAGIRMTHRAVGPIGRMKTALERIAQGDYNVRVTLRKGDPLTELAEAVTHVAARLRERRS